MEHDPMPGPLIDDFRWRGSNLTAILRSSAVLAVVLLLVRGRYRVAREARRASPRPPRRHGRRRGRPGRRSLGTDRRRPALRRARGPPLPPGGLRPRGGQARRRTGRWRNARRAGAATLPGLPARAAGLT